MAQMVANLSGGQGRVVVLPVCLEALVGLSGSCQVKAHDESIPRRVGWKPRGLCLLFECRDELGKLAAVL